MLQIKSNDAPKIRKTGVVPQSRIMPNFVQQLQIAVRYSVTDMTTTLSYTPSSAEGATTKKEGFLSFIPQPLMDIKSSFEASPEKYSNEFIKDLVDGLKNSSVYASSQTIKRRSK